MGTSLRSWLVFISLFSVALTASGETSEKCSKFINFEIERAKLGHDISSPSECVEKSKLEGGILLKKNKKCAGFSVEYGYPAPSSEQYSASAVRTVTKENKVTTYFSLGKTISGPEPEDKLMDPSKVVFLGDDCLISKVVIDSHLVITPEVCKQKSSAESIIAACKDLMQNYGAFIKAGSQKQEEKKPNAEGGAR